MTSTTRLKWMHLLAAAWLFVGMVGFADPVPGAHSHNDYEHGRPLLDALDQGFCSVEADIFAVDGQLLVAHDRHQIKPERTLQALYLDPLRERVKANGGRVFRDGPEFFLLIDFKTGAGPTWAALEPVLEGYRDLLTEFRTNSTHRQAVTIVLSGNSPREQLDAAAIRRAAIDGRLPDLTANPSPHLVPWISENWINHFQWRGWGDMPADEKTKLRGLVARAHAQGRQVRFWGAPDLDPLWREQFDAGVDFINTDKLAGLAAFLKDRRR
ncbi:MAG: phosphatidylinositol-specific phospholipase C/glycerophosphodiester phosphodiesterase family protein [Limisphaerales bacterium]